MAEYTKTPDQSKEIDLKNTPMIVISASGMAEAGRILHDLKVFLPDARNTILFTGYQDGGTRGDRLIRGETEIKIHGEMIPVRAQIHVHEQYVSSRRLQRNAGVAEPYQNATTKSVYNARRKIRIAIPENQNRRKVWLEMRYSCLHANGITGMNTLKLVKLGIDTLNEFVVYMRSDCFICKSEGFEALTQLVVSCHGNSIVATLNMIESNVLHHNEASLSESAWKRLGVNEGDEIQLSHLEPVSSLAYVRSKIHGKELTSKQFDEIISDIVSGKYSNIHLSSFITACVEKV